MDKKFNKINYSNNQSEISILINLIFSLIFITSKRIISYYICQFSYFIPQMQIHINRCQFGCQFKNQLIKRFLIHGLIFWRSYYYNLDNHQSYMKASQIISLFAGFMVMLVNGSLYVYGTMTPYISTFLYYKGATSLNISDLSIILTIAVIFTNVGIFASNFKIISFSNRITSLIAVSGISLAMLILSFVEHFAFYVVIYGCLYGFFIGFGYMAPLKNCYDHLPNRKGLCSGACLMGFGLGAFFFNYILVDIVNPDNLKQDKNHHFPEEIGNRLPLAFQVLAGVYAATGIIGVLLTRPPKPSQDAEMARLVTKTDEEDQLQGNSHCSKFAFQLANEKKITWLTLILGTTVPFGLFVAFNYKEYGLYYINDDHYLSTLGSIGSVGNGVFRMFWGILMDILPFKRLKYIMIAIFVVSCATILWSVQNQASYLITVLITYGTYGGLYSIYPTQTVRMLGRQLGPKLYYITFIGFSSGGVLQYLAHKFLVEQFKQEGYTYCFIIFGVLLFVSAFLIFTTDLEPATLKEKQQSKIQTTIEQD